MKPSIPKGTRDFLPAEVNKRKYIFETIESVYQKYGYLPIETPAMESLDTLTGKYGEEGDKLLFKVLNNGDFLSKANNEALEAKDSDKLVSSISKRGLRYDLTVPFARFVVMHQNDLSFPFKRYQIQPVWRADRPQKGRYQEFWQCDADVVGSDSLVYEAEIIEMLYEVYADLGLDVLIRINNRKILNGIAEVCGIANQFMDMTIAIDKLDKIGRDGVIRELGNKGIDVPTSEKLLSIVMSNKLDEIRNAVGSSTIGSQGIKEIDTIFSYLQGRLSLHKVAIDVTLARGLNYYTGCIFEVVHNPETYPDLVMGSISGGGRYDNLTEVFGMKGNSGVGISFGADRIYDVLDALDLYPQTIQKSLDILLVAFDQPSHDYAYKVLLALRDEGIKADIYPEPAKMKKQLKYADDRQIPFVGIIGDNEIKENKVMLKNMKSGEQEALDIHSLAQKLKG
jgi:histidyl-tRNA synthetase